MHHFNIRVYGVLVNEQKQVLVADEYIRGGYYTKFPGGGLEFGEGTRDCLKREFMEEMNLSVSVDDHIYTTDYFQCQALLREIIPVNKTKGFCFVFFSIYFQLAFIKIKRLCS